MKREDPREGASVTDFPAYVPGGIADEYAYIMTKDSGYSDHERATATRLVRAPAMQPVYERLGSFDSADGELRALFERWVTASSMMIEGKREVRDATEKAAKMLKEAQEYAEKLRNIALELDRLPMRIAGPCFPSQSQYRLMIGMNWGGSHPQGAQHLIGEIEEVVGCAVRNVDQFYKQQPWFGSQKTTHGMWREFLRAVHIMLDQLNEERIRQFNLAHLNDFKLPDPPPITLRETDWQALVVTAMQPAYPVTRDNMKDALKKYREDSVNRWRW